MVCSMLCVDLRGCEVVSGAWWGCSGHLLVLPAAGAVVACLLSPLTGGCQGCKRCDDSAGVSSWQGLFGGANRGTFKASGLRCAQAGM